MICKHNIESENGCKVCWKERAERAEAACAEMRAVLEHIAEYWNGNPGEAANNAAEFCQMEADEVVKKITLGQGWLSPEKAKTVEQALITLRQDYNTDSIGWDIATNALAAVAKGEQK